jgi:DNA-binding transcriptional LysR family regulator
MFSDLPSLKALHAFEAAARLASFAEAAIELSVSPGAVSYQIKKLEDSLGTPLFLRKTRKVVLTAAGRTLYQLVHHQFQELDTTIKRIAPAKHEAPLTISVSTYFVTRWLSPRMGQFLNAHPKITIRLQHSVNDPDFSVDDTDIAIRWGDGNWPNSSAHLLFPLPMIAVCSPSLLKGKNRLSRLKNIAHHRLLRDQTGTDYWAEWLLKAGASTVTQNGPVIVDPNVRVQSAIDGQGLVLANPLVDPLIQQGLLCEPFEVRLQGYGYYLVHSDRVSENRQYTVFRDWIIEEASVMQ